MDLANKLAEILAAKLGYTDEQRKVIAYGLGAILQMLTLLIIATIFGLAFECFYECMIVFFGVGLMRRTTGGTHCSTYMACILTSSLSICLIALLYWYLLFYRKKKKYSDVEVVTFAEDEEEDDSEFESDDDIESIDEYEPSWDDLEEIMKERSDDYY